MAAINNILNGDQGLTVRQKLNILCDLYNNIAVSDSVYSLQRLNEAFIKSASPTGKFLKDDGTWANIVGASLADTLTIGNTTGGFDILSENGWAKVSAIDINAAIEWNDGTNNGFIKTNPYKTNIGHNILNEFNAPSNVFNGALQATSPDFLSVLRIVNTYAQLSYDNGGVIIDTFKTALSHGSIIELSAPSITVSQEPSTALQVATKSYVDSAVAGLIFKKEAKACATVDIDVTNPGTSTFDGVLLSAGDRLLLINQTDLKQNGVYVFNGSSVALTRATDMDSGAEIANKTVPVISGTVYHDTWFTCTNDIIVIGVNNINYSQTAGTGTYTYGNYLKLTGNVFDIDFTTFNSDSITEGSTNLYFTSARQALFVPFSGSANDLDLNGKVLKNFYLSKTADNTAKLLFDLTSLSTASTKTISFLNESGTAYLGNKSVQTLTDGATITWNVSQGQNANVTLGGNRALAISNAVAGEYYTIRVIQDGTGSRTLSLPAGSKVVAGGSGSITLTSTPGAMDILTAYYNGSNYYWTYGNNFN